MPKSHPKRRKPPAPTTNPTNARITRLAHNQHRNTHPERTILCHPYTNPNLQEITKTTQNHNTKPNRQQTRYPAPGKCPQGTIKPNRNTAQSRTTNKPTTQPLAPPKLVPANRQPQPVKTIRKQIKTTQVQTQTNKTQRQEAMPYNHPKPHSQTARANQPTVLTQNRNPQAPTPHANTTPTNTRITCPHPRKPHPEGSILHYSHHSRKIGNHTPQGNKQTQSSPTKAT